MSLVILLIIETFHNYIRQLHRWNSAYAILSLFRMDTIFCLDNCQEYKRYESLQKNYIDAYKWSKHGFLPLSDARSVLDLGI